MGRMTLRLMAETVGLQVKVVIKERDHSPGMDKNIHRYSCLNGVCFM